MPVCLDLRLSLSFSAANELQKQKHTRFLANTQQLQCVGLRAACCGLALAGGTRPLIVTTCSNVGYYWYVVLDLALVARLEGEDQGRGRGRHRGEAPSSTFLLAAWR